MKEILIGNLEQKSKIKLSLPPNMEEELIKCLRLKKDFFRLEGTRMLGIDPNFIAHKLFLNLNAKVTQ